MRNPTRLILSFALLLTLGASAQPLTDRLPASTLLYVGWSPNASLQTTATAKMLADERFMGPWRRVFQEFLLDMRDGPDGGEKLSAHLPTLLADAAQCEGAFALLELKQGKRHFNPQSVLMLDLGARRKSFEEAFRPLHNRMRERVGDRLKMVKLQNAWVYTKPDREGKAHLTWGFVGDTFVFFAGDEAAQFIPKLVNKTIGQTLKDAPAFADAVSKVPGESVFTTYLDAKASLALVRRFAQRDAGGDLDLLVKNWDKLVTEFGLDNVKAVAEKTVVQDQQFVTRTLVRTDGAPKGLLSLLATQAVDDDMMRAIPADAMAAAAVRLDPLKTFDQIKQAAQNVGGDDAKEAFNQLEQGAEALGLPIRTVLEAVGDQWVLYNAQSTGGFAFTGWTLVAKIRDPQKFDRSLDTIRGMIAKGFGGGDGNRAALRFLQADGQRIEYLQLGRWTAFAPAWTKVGEDKFVLAFYPQLVEDAAAQIKDKDAKSLLDNPDYAAARKRTGNDGPMVYTSGPEVTKNLYPVGLLIASLIDSFAGSFDSGPDGEGDDAWSVGPDLLPSMKRMLSYVGHDALAYKVTPDGLLKTRTVANPLLSPLAWLDSPTVWLALAVPSIGAAEEAADREKSANNLRQIGHGIAQYGLENQEKFPPDLDAVLKQPGVGQDLARSPFGPAKEGKDVVLLTYGGKVKMNGPNSGGVVVAYDQAALDLGDGTNALYDDGRIEWLTPDNFKRALEESKKKVALLNAEP